MPNDSSLHHNSFVADLHCDTALQILRGYDFSKQHDNYHIDLPRLQEGGINLQIFAAFVDSSLPKGERFKRAERLLDSLIAELNKYPEQITICYSYEDIITAYENNKIAALLAIENGMAIEEDLKNLEYFYNKGVRYLTLTHSKSHSWCSSSSDDQSDKFGLTDFGCDVIKEMNRLGMIVDVSHISEKAFYDVLKITDSPVIASHSNAFALCPHDRNLKDDQLKALAENKGLVGVNFCCEFLSEQFWKKSDSFMNKQPEKLNQIENLFGSELDEGTLSEEWEKLSDFIEQWREFTKPYRPDEKTVTDHIEHIKNTAGEDYIGLGSDYDGIGCTPKNLEGCSCLPSLTQELIRRNYSDSQIKKILGKNFLRVAQAVFK